MERRDLLKLGGAIAAAPSAAQISKSIQSGGAVDNPELFDRHQLETVAVLADLIIPRTGTPGARDANVHVYLDRILAISPMQIRASFLEGLAWLDGYCLRTDERPFDKLPQARQIKILEALSGKPDPALRRGQDFFAAMKLWTSRIYYATEAGHKELKKYGPAPATYACRHPDHG